MFTLKQLVDQLPLVREQSRDTKLLQERRRYETDPANVIVVPSTLSKSHPLVQARLEREKKLAASLRIPLHKRPQDTDMWSRRAVALPLHVSGPQIIRALSIYDALLRAVAARDMEFWLVPNRLRVYCNQGIADLRLSETSLNASRKQWSGLLRLSIESRAGPVRSLIDSDGKTLEAQLNQAMVMIAEATVLSKKWLYSIREGEEVLAAQIAKSKAAALLQAERKLINEEKAARAAALISEAENWRTAQNLRAYAAHLEERSRSSPDRALETSSVIAELRQVALELDPTNDRIPDL